MNYFEHVQKLNHLQLICLVEQMQSELKTCRIALADRKHLTFADSQKNSNNRIQDNPEVIRDRDDSLEKPTDRIVKVYCKGEFGFYTMLATYIKPLKKWISADGEMIEDPVISWENKGGN